MRFGGRHLLPPPDPELIRTLGRLLTEAGLTEIEYSVGRCRIRVARGSATGGVPLPVSWTAAAPEQGAAGAAAVAVDHPDMLTAPMVGTAYLSPQPGAPPFVRVGGTVVVGQTVLVIEAMKVMNEIPAPRSGRVTQILTADAQPVEYGAPLMLIE